jgi:hypothetical protein
MIDAEPVQEDRARLDFVFGRYFVRHNDDP